MKSHEPSQSAPHVQPEFHGTLRSYIIGFALSLMLTLTAYITVVQKALSDTAVIAIVVGLAILQFAVQLVFFLHIHRESKPRLNLLIFSFMLLVLGIIVIGSLWIMYNLDYNMSHMLPDEVDKQLLEQEGIKY